MGGVPAERVERGAPERIRLHRSVALVSADRIAVRPVRAGLIAPLVQAAIAAGAIWMIVAFIATLPALVLLLCLLVALVLGPIAVLGLVYQLIGTSFLMERAKRSARWQQGFLGLGIGTHEFVPFTRIARIEAVGDGDEPLPGGDVQDVVQWDVRLVKDNGRVLTVGTVVAARALEAEAADRAHALARALAEMAGSEARLAPLPEPADGGEQDATPPSAPEPGRRRYRRVDREETADGP